MIDEISGGIQRVPVPFLSFCVTPFTTTKKIVILAATTFFTIGVCYTKKRCMKDPIFQPKKITNISRVLKSSSVVCLFQTLKIKAPKQETKKMKIDSSAIQNQQKWNLESAELVRWRSMMDEYRIPGKQDFEALLSHPEVGDLIKSLLLISSQTVFPKMIHLLEPLYIHSDWPILLEMLTKIQVRGFMHQLTPKEWSVFLSYHLMHRQDHACQTLNLALRQLDELELLDKNHFMLILINPKLSVFLEILSCLKKHQLIDKKNFDILFCAYGRRVDTIFEELEIVLNYLKKLNLVDDQTALSVFFHPQITDFLSLVMLFRNHRFLDADLFIFLAEQTQSLIDAKWILELCDSFQRVDLLDKKRVGFLLVCLHGSEFRSMYERGICQLNEIDIKLKLSTFQNKCFRFLQDFELKQDVFGQLELLKQSESLECMPRWIELQIPCVLELNRIIWFFIEIDCFNSINLNYLINNLRYIGLINLIICRLSCELGIWSSKCLEQLKQVEVEHLFDLQYTLKMLFEKNFFGLSKLDTWELILQDIERTAKVIVLLDEIHLFNADIWALYAQNSNVFWSRLNQYVLLPSNTRPKFFDVA